jgi:hypothetical protein
MARARMAKSCGPDVSTLASSWRKKTSAGDGDKKARSPGRARRKPLKPSRAGMPGDPGGPVVTTLVWFLFFPREAAGAMGTRHSPRPHWAEDFMHDSGALRRGSVEVCLHVIARSERDEAIHLSRGWHGLLRFARNDGRGCLKIWIEPERALFPPPLWGRVREGGGRIGTARVDPSPQPSPTRGEGIFLTAVFLILFQGVA